MEKWGEIGRIIHYLNEVNSRFAFLFDKTYEIIKDSVSKTNLKQAIVVTAADSLPADLKLLYTLKVGRLELNASTFITWKQFIDQGKGHTCETSIDKYNKRLSGLNSIKCLIEI